MGSSSLLKLTNCCGCFSLRTGTLIILWFNMIHSVLVMTYMSFILGRKYTNESAWEYFASALYFESVVVFGLVPSIYALYSGVYKKKPAYLQFVVALGILAILILYTIALAFFYMYLNRRELLQFLVDQMYRRSPTGQENIEVPSAGAFVLAIWIAVFISSLIQWYLTSVVHSYYLKLKEELRPYAVGYVATPKV